MFGPKKNKLVTDKDAVGKVLLRRLEATGIFPNKEEAIEMLTGQSLRIYLGIDPTGPDIHLGHSIPLLFLKQLWELGHHPVIVVGDFTARIGDPTDKTATRKQLSAEQIKENCKNYIRQVEKLLPAGSFEVKYNNDWLGKLSFGEIIELASHVTVQQMIQRDMFQERIKKEEPISLNEFLYPLMQGYDSVALKIDGEVGGNDQTFNMLVGRTLEKKLLNKEKLVFATQLLANNEGKKMSKTEGGIISVTDEPREIRRKVLALDDTLVGKVFELCTEQPMEWVEANRNKEPRAFKEELADELVKMYHGAEAVNESREAEGVSAGPLVDVVASVLNASKSEAKRMVEQKAITVNEEIISDWNHPVKSGDKIQIGKGRFVEVK